MSELVITEQIGRISVVTLNAPAQRNALSVDMRLALTEALRRSHAAPACRAIVLTGAEGQFCAGGDLKLSPELAAEPPALRTPRLMSLLHVLVREITGGPCPIVAAVDGYALGAGLSLAAACDSIIAGPSAKFSASFGRVGLFADSGLLWTLPQRIGIARTRQLLLSARVVEAPEALAIGLADALAGPGDTRAAAIAEAERLSATAPLAIAATRAAFAQGVPSLEAAFDLELREQPRLTASRDYEEGKAAFREKRKPDFEGR